MYRLPLPRRRRERHRRARGERGQERRPRVQPRHLPGRGSLPGLEAAAELWDRGAFARGHAACFGRRREEWIEIGAMEALRERCGKKHSQPTTVSSVSNSWTWPSTAASLRLLAVGRRRAEARWIRENKASNARRRWTLRAYPDPRRAA
jgi:hypothetical protein